MYVDSKSKIAAIICYLFSWVGIIVAFLIRDKRDELSLHHLNQALVLAIIETISGALRYIPVVGRTASFVLGLGVLVLSFMGIFRAANGSKEPLPIVGEFHILD